MAGGVGVPGLAPLGTVFDDPVRQRLLEADVVSRLLGFDPFVAKNLLSLRLELAVERGVLEQVARRC